MSISFVSSNLYQNDAQNPQPDAYSVYKKYFTAGDINLERQAGSGSQGTGYVFKLSGGGSVNAERVKPYTGITVIDAYPNPFNPSTKIKYYLPEEAFVKLKVYNLLGKEILTVVEKNQQTGFYEYTFNAGDLSSGIYFYKLSAVNFAGKETVQTRKMTLIR